MPEYICSSCGGSFEAEPDAQGKIICVSCGAVLPAADTPQALPAGTRIAGYEIIRHIAAGGSGTVYLAEQIAMERTVALKILNQERMDKDSSERFLEEARNTARFENPHVVPIIDTGLSPEGFHYIAMPYVEGETLEEILLRGRVFSEEETLIIGITVADALRSVWNKCRMFHKDIKPGNIMLTPENEVMILDLGTAQEHGESKLADGDIEGSPYYMSPEQARGEALTWSTDLYSLGAAMYQMLTGKYLYDGEEVEEILRQHDGAPFPDPAVRAPEMHVSEKMTELLRRMLEKTPSGRYGSWEEFIRHAQRLLDSVWERKGAAFPDSLRKQYMALQKKSAAKPVLKLQNRPSSWKIVCSGLLIFILGAALLGGIFLYLAARKNSANARILLDPIRREANSLEMVPDMLEEKILKAEPYFRRIGVLPSVRKEFEKCKFKVKEFRELNRKEENRINQLEAMTAEQLQAADREERKAGEAAQKSSPQAAAHFKRSLAILQQTSDTVKNAPFVLLPNIRRSGQLQERLAAARRNIQRELSLFRRKHSERRIPPAGMNPAMPSATAPAPSVSGSRAGGGEKKPLRENLRPGPVRQAPALSPEQQYRRSLRQEMDRIRVQLQLAEMREKIRPDHPVWQSRVRQQPFPEQNRWFEQWRSMLKRRTAEAAKVWNAVYNSHQTFSGFHFTIPTRQGDTRMELRTILRDTVVLYRRGMQNIRMKFGQLARAEWLDFLRFAASRTGLNRELDSYLLLDGWFMMAEKSADVRIREEVRAAREIFFRWLSGEKIPGLEGLEAPVKPEILEKYRTDPAFAPYRARLKKNKNGVQHRMNL